jgi:putative FmdB family regulatory protein
MSVYEYKCTKCGEKFEIRHSIFIRSKDKEVCPNCGFNQAERVYSSFCSGSNSEGSQASTPTRHFG